MRCSDLLEEGGCLETGTEGWVTVEHDESKALERIPFLVERSESEPLAPWEKVERTACSPAVNPLASPAVPLLL